MNQLIIIVGLPGSGKTHLINTKYTNYRIFDDFDLMQIDILLDSLKTNNVVVASPNFCVSNVRDLMSSYLKGYKFEWVFFENNPQKCIENIKYRNDKRNVMPDIQALTRIYKIPQDIKPIEIWQYEI